MRARKAVNDSMATTASPFYNDGTKLFHWNWVGFLDPLGFGYAHRAYKTYLFFLPSVIPCVLAALWTAGKLPSFVPLLSLPLLLVWNIGCGAMGEKIAWTVGLYEDGVAFRAAMDSWNRAGRLHLILMIVFLGLLLGTAATVYFLFWNQIQAWISNIPF